MLHIFLNWKKRLPKPVTSTCHWFCKIMEKKVTIIFVTGKTQP
jgi:hypothetical protein